MGIYSRGSDKQGVTVCQRVVLSIEEIVMYICIVVITATLVCVCVCVVVICSFHFPGHLTAPKQVHTRPYGHKEENRRPYRTRISQKIFIR